MVPEIFAFLGTDTARPDFEKTTFIFKFHLFLTEGREDQRFFFSPTMSFNLNPCKDFNPQTIFSNSIYKYTYSLLFLVCKVLILTIVAPTFNSMNNIIANLTDSDLHTLINSIMSPIHYLFHPLVQNLIQKVSISGGCGNSSEEKQKYHNTNIHKTMLNLDIISLMHIIYR